MKLFLHLCIVLAVCQVVLGAQQPYGNPGNPPHFARQPNPRMTDDQDRRVPQQSTQQSTYQDSRSFGAQVPSSSSPQPHEQQQNQYQQMMQQQQQQRPLGVYTSPVYLPFGRNQQEAQSPGIFSKLKSSILAAGSAISDSLSQSSLDGTPPVTNPPGTTGFYGQTGYPQPTQQQYAPSSHHQQQQQQKYRYPGQSYSGDYRPTENGNNGLVGKFKSLFGLDDASTSDTRSTRDSYTRAGGPLPPHLSQQYAPYSVNPHASNVNQGNVANSGSSGVANPFGDKYLDSNIPQVPPYGTNVPPFPADGAGDYPEMPLPVQRQQPLQLGQTYSTRDNSNYNVPPSADKISSGLASPEDTPIALYPDPTMQSTLDTHSSTTTHPSVDPMVQINPEPQVFVHEGSIVMINKPREFGRKKLAFTRVGSEKIQVFSDFEHVMTQFNTLNGERTLTSAELLETSGAVHDRAVQQLNAIAEEFESSGDSYLDSAAFEQLSAQCQRVLCKEGELHISAVPQITRALLPRLGLRAGWSDMLHALAVKGVPTYLFSSGYGDVVTQVLLQGMTSMSNSGVTTSAPNVPQPLPQNLRVISNFFRAAPDGTVRAFSHPIVHERNKNASTAAQHMGMPVLNRPYAIVLGAHEDDVNMTEGVEGLVEQISVGYLELTEDLSQRLPIYLNTFDVVIIGDGNLQYVRHMIEDILQLPPTSTKGSTSTSSGGLNINTLSQGINSIGLGNIGLNTVSSAGQGIATGLRNRLGMLLNSGNNNNPQQPGNQQLPGRAHKQQHQPQYPQQQQQQYTPPSLPSQPQMSPVSPPSGYAPPPTAGYAYHNNVHNGENTQPPPTTVHSAGLRPQPTPQQAHTSSLPGANNPFNVPTIPGNTNTENSDGETPPRPFSYLDFNEYQ